MHPARNYVAVFAAMSHEPHMLIRAPEKKRKKKKKKTKKKTRTQRTVKKCVKSVFTYEQNASIFYCPIHGESTSLSLTIVARLPTLTMPQPCDRSDHEEMREGFLFFIAVHLCADPASPAAILPGAGDLVVANRPTRSTARPTTRCTAFYTSHAQYAMRHGTDLTLLDDNVFTGLTRNRPRIDIGPGPAGGSHILPARMVCACIRDFTRD